MKISISDLFYSAFLVIMFAVKGLGLYDGQPIYKICFIAAIICFALRVATNNHTRREIGLILLLGILAVLMNRSSGEKGFLIIYMTLIGMKNYPIRRIMQVGLYAFGISVFLRVLMSLAFQMGSPISYHERLGMIIARDGLGYPHPNTTAMTYFVCCVLIVYCLQERYNAKTMSLLMLGNVMVFLFCMSYTGFAICVGYLVGAYVLEHARPLRRVLGIAIYFVLPGCILFSVLLPAFITDKGMEFLQIYASTLYSRVRLSREFVTPANISLLGTNVAMLTDSQYTLDNSYLYCFVFNGVLASILLVLGNIYMVHYEAKRNNYREMLIILAYFGYGVLEPLLFNTSFKNLTIFFMGESLWYLLGNLQGNTMSRAISHGSILLNRYIDFGKVFPSIKEWEEKNRIVFTKKQAVLFVGITAGAALVTEWLHPVLLTSFEPWIQELYGMSPTLAKSMQYEAVRAIVRYWCLFASLYLAIWCACRNFWTRKCCK